MKNNYIFQSLVVLLLLFTSCNNSSKVFEFVVLPDTQSYVEKWPEIYNSQMQWIADNAESYAFAIHEGDLTQYNSSAEWNFVRDGFKKLDGQIPYTFSLGNHDMGSAPRKLADERNTTEANAVFSVEQMAKNGNVFATFPEGKIDNLCSRFYIAGFKWLVFSLEFGVRNSTIAWADSIIASNVDAKVIINTHAYMYQDDTRMGGDDWWQPQGYGVGKDVGDEAVNNGEQIWEKLGSKHVNILMVFSGHVLKRGVGTLVSEGVNGNQVYQMLANYQEGTASCVDGGSGFLRIIRVDVANETIEVRTYSPWTKEYKTDKLNNFSFENVKF